MRKAFLALGLACPCANALSQTLECLPSPHAGTMPAPGTRAESTPVLTTGAIHIGPADDRLELAGGDVQRRKDGYDIVYRFPGHEPKWLMCAYGEDGDIQSFEPARDDATECRLQVNNEGKPGARVRMTCK